MKREEYLKLQGIKEELERLEIYTETHSLNEAKRKSMGDKIYELRNLKSNLEFKIKLSNMLGGNHEKIK